MNAIDVIGYVSTAGDVRYRCRVVKVPYPPENT